MAHDLRRRIGFMDRGLAEQLALGRATESETHDHEAVRRYQESLPPRMPALASVALVAGFLVLAQAIANGLIAYGPFGEAADRGRGLTDALGNLGGLSPNPAALGELARAVARADLEMLFAFISALLVAGYLIGRPAACGFRIAHLTLGEPDETAFARRESQLERTVSGSGIRRLEPRVFEQLGSAPSPGFPVDLAIKALLAALFLFGGIYGMRTGLVDDDDRWKFWPLLAIGALRLAWLARAALVRGRGVAWLVVPLTVLVAIATLAKPLDTFGGDDTAADQTLAMTLGLQPDLSGVDLRKRNLTRIHLVGKRMRYANLAGAEMQYADLRAAELRDADLTDTDLLNADLSEADLRDADLSGAQLGATKLDRADLRGALLYTSLDHVSLCGADLRGAELPEPLEGAPSYDAETLWPSGVTPPPQDPVGIGCE
jgi:hypothetical protein